MDPLQIGDLEVPLGAGPSLLEVDHELFVLRVSVSLPLVGLPDVGYFLGLLDLLLHRVSHILLSRRESVVHLLGSSPLGGSVGHHCVRQTRLVLCCSELRVRVIEVLLLLGLARSAMQIFEV